MIVLGIIRSDNGQVDAMQTTIMLPWSQTRKDIDRKQQ
jgi:hypothetical protein